MADHLDPTSAATVELSADDPTNASHKADHDSTSAIQNQNQNQNQNHNTKVFSNDSNALLDADRTSNNDNQCSSEHRRVIACEFLKSYVLLLVNAFRTNNDFNGLFILPKDSKSIPVVYSRLNAERFSKKDNLFFVFLNGIWNIILVCPNYSMVYVFNFTQLDSSQFQKILSSDMFPIARDIKNIMNQTVPLHLYNNYLKTRHVKYYNLYEIGSTQYISQTMNFLKTLYLLIKHKDQVLTINEIDILKQQLEKIRLRHLFCLDAQDIMFDMPIHRKNNYIIPNTHPLNTQEVSVEFEKQKLIENEDLDKLNNIDESITFSISNLSEAKSKPICFVKLNDGSQIYPRVVAYKNDYKAFNKQAVISSLNLDNIKTLSLFLFLANIDFNLVKVLEKKVNFSLQPQDFLLKLGGHREIITSSLNKSIQCDLALFLSLLSNNLIVLMTYMQLLGSKFNVSIINFDVLEYFYSTLDSHLADNIITADAFYPNGLNPLSNLDISPYMRRVKENEGQLVVLVESGKFVSYIEQNDTCRLEKSSIASIKDIVGSINSHLLLAAKKTGDEIQTLEINRRNDTATHLENQVNLLSQHETMVIDTNSLNQVNYNTTLRDFETHGITNSRPVKKFQLVKDVQGLNGEKLDFNHSNSFEQREPVKKQDFAQMKTSISFPDKPEIIDGNIGLIADTNHANCYPKTAAYSIGKRFQFIPAESKASNQSQELIQAASVKDMHMRNGSATAFAQNRFRQLLKIKAGSQSLLNTDLKNSDYGRRLVSPSLELSNGIISGKLSTANQSITSTMPGFSPYMTTAQASDLHPGMVQRPRQPLNNSANNISDLQRPQTFTGLPLEKEMVMVALKKNPLLGQLGDRSTTFKNSMLYLKILGQDSGIEKYSALYMKALLFLKSHFISSLFIMLKVLACQLFKYHSADSTLERDQANNYKEKSRYLSIVFAHYHEIYIDLLTVVGIINEAPTSATSVYYVQRAAIERNKIVALSDLLANNNLFRPIQFHDLIFKMVDSDLLPLLFCNFGNHFVPIDPAKQNIALSHHLHDIRLLVDDIRLPEFIAQENVFSVATIFFNDVSLKGGEYNGSGVTIDYSGITDNNNSALNKFSGSENHIRPNNVTVDGRVNEKVNSNGIRLPVGKSINDNQSSWPISFHDDSKLNNSNIKSPPQVASLVQPHNSENLRPRSPVVSNINRLPLDNSSVHAQSNYVSKQSAANNINHDQPLTAPWTGSSSPVLGILQPDQLTREQQHCQQQKRPLREPQQFILHQSLLPKQQRQAIEHYKHQQHQQLPLHMLKQLGVQSVSLTTKYALALHLNSELNAKLQVLMAKKNIVRAGNKAARLASHVAKTKLVNAMKRKHSKFSVKREKLAMELQELRKKAALLKEPL